MKKIKLDSIEIKKIKTLFPSYERKKNLNYEFDLFKLKNLTLHIYSNGTLLIQGKNKEKEAFIELLENRILNKNKIQEKEHWGGDESGVGDLFGPIVITLFFYDKKIWEFNKKYGLTDSKKISNWEILNQIGKKLKDFKNNYVTKIITPLMLAKHYKNGKNLKEILTFYYIEAINEITSDKKQNIIIDGFVHSDTWEKYKKKWEWKVNNKIQLITKAEDKYFGVGAASIISRYYFLKNIQEIEKKLNLKVLLGASADVKNQILMLINKWGETKLKNYIKLNYRWKI